VKIIKKNKITDLPRKILIRTVNHRLGDSLMIFPFLSALKKLFPDTPAVIAVPRHNARIFYNTGFTVFEIGRTWPLKISDHLAYLSFLRKEHFDCAFILQRALEGAFLSWLAGIPGRLGYASDHRNFLLTGSLSEESWNMNTARMHTSEYYLDLLRAFYNYQGLKPERLEPAVLDNDIHSASLKCGFKITENTFILAGPGSSYGSAKFWPLKRWAELLKRLRLKYSLPVILAGAEHDKLITACLKDLLDFPTVNLCAVTSMGELFALAKYAGLVITVDSGLSHLRSAFGRSLAVLFGSTNEKLTGPYYSGESIREEFSCAPCLEKSCPRAENPLCMEALSLEKVWNIICSSGQCRIEKNINI